MIAERIAPACLKAAVAAGAFVGAPAIAENDRGLRLGASYTADSIANVRGGLDTGFSQMGLLELTATVEDGLFGIDGAAAHASGQYVHGRSLNGKLIGDAQVTSNIDAPSGIRLFEAWLSLPLGRETYVKAGLIDLNSEFDVQDVGALFLNSSHGIGPDFSQSGLNGPSIFPTTSSAVMFSAGIGDATFRAGLFDAVAGDPERPRFTVVRAPGETGLLLVGEAEYRLSEQSEIQLGGWAYTSRFDVVPDNDAANRRRGNRGAYVLAETQLGKMGAAPVGAWVRIGIADARFNAIGTYVGGGVTVGTDASKFGVAVAHARLGEQSQLAGTDRAETVIEMTYAHAINDRLTIQPDVQLVINPGFDSTLRNSLSGGVRLQLAVF